MLSEDEKRIFFFVYEENVFLRIIIQDKTNKSFAEFGAINTK